MTGVTADEVPDEVADMVADMVADVVAAVLLSHATGRMASALRMTIPTC